MGIIPNKVQEQLAFFNMHAPLWVANATSIGLTTGQATIFASKAADAQASWEAQQSQISKARSATIEAQAMIGDARATCAALIAIIKGFAENSANPATVYSMAEIPAPAAPSPVGPPGTPYEPRVELLQTGAIVISWKCTNPSNGGGTIYEVTRRLGGSGPYTMIGGTGVRSFTDDSIPAGSGSVYYQVTGVRSTQRGNTATFTVQFGVDGPGLTVSDVSAGPVKLAA